MVLLSLEMHLVKLTFQRSETWGTAKQEPVHKRTALGKSSVYSFRTTILQYQPLGIEQSLNIKCEYFTFMQLHQQTCILFPI